ncbi:MAG: 16S rRNA (uracil(1498)-N(3))-methyltransferase [Fibrobacter sp.]|jgi:16S rRNA (uracil1498-N3)-methyltransferase|nr:16S rRNA (uracil(1498)-N(3))-methyltransferase [Fibrobacter sp.]
MKSPDTHFYHRPLTAGILTLSPEESAHAVRACRVRPGDTIRLCDGEGHFAEGTVTAASAAACSVQVDSVQTSEIPKPHFHLALACLKDDGNEETVFHASQTNLGSVIFLRTEHSSEPKNSDLGKMKRRSEMKSLVSLKQSLKPWLTEIQGPFEIKDWLKNYRGNLILCDIDGNETIPAEDLLALKNSKTPATLLIGPEGGFSESEIQSIRNYSHGKVFLLRLGSTRLRARTAAIIALGKLS